MVFFLELMRTIEWPHAAIACVAVTGLTVWGMFRKAVNTDLDRVREQRDKYRHRLLRLEKTPSHSVDY